ncbi:hypothetical protein [Brachyspira hampsonii]|uniref:Uncharacterized protein n=1 Tax=Brachyspira hampsonii 30446 TaxID=1289135 RepID=A0A2U4EWG2_9SPIR|nr:hypothetical protein [Brachyspira hampsonii]EKV57356.1 hypothetical protein A966_05763 [Brachyspira hampsonii 30446]MBW5389898.1 hypothetical protein [Brachyspira hampsonii]MBW5396047.1 hypothetical protein [Brachyspira hampsonii]OEJ19029.1 hypothetical protein A9495_00330 [Brachyspira hampsonii]
MNKILLLFITLLIISMQAFSAAVTTHYNNWKIRRISYNNTDTKTVTMTIKNNNSLEVYIAARNNQLSVSINWYKDKIDENTPIVEYSFNNSPYKSVEPFMRSSSDNFDILYTISPAFGIIQEKEVIEFLNKLINSKTLSIKPNTDAQGYTIDVTGLKEAIQKTDFSGTLFDKYKSQILK